MKEFNFQWHITNFCNLHCKHCYQDDFRWEGDLSWPDLKSICDNIFSFLRQRKKITQINLTGGEPLLKKELFILLDYLNRSPLVKELAIITNALLLDKSVIKDLTAFSKLRKIKVSLEGEKAINDSVRGEGVFEKVEKAIDLVKTLSNLETILMFTLLKRNIGDLPRLFDFCKNKKLDGMIIERFIPWGQGKNIKDEVLDAELWEDVVKLIFSFCSVPISDEKEVIAYKAFWVKFLPCELDLAGAFCNVGDDALCIMPKGEIFPCRRFNLAIGNLLKNSLEDILKEAYLLGEVRQKENLKGKCKTCLIKDCIGCRALAYSLRGDYLESDPQCWYRPNILLR